MVEKNIQRISVSNIRGKAGCNWKPKKITIFFQTLNFFSKPKKIEDTPDFHHLIDANVISQDSGNFSQPATASQETDPTSSRDPLDVLSTIDGASTVSYRVMKHFFFLKI